MVWRQELWDKRNEQEKAFVWADYFKVINERPADLDKAKDLGRKNKAFEFNGRNRQGTGVYLLPNGKVIEVYLIWNSYDEYVECESLEKWEKYERPMSCYGWERA